MSAAAARPTRSLLAELDGMLATFTPDAARRKPGLLAVLRTRELRTARELLTLHRAACFLCAFPDDAAVHGAARGLTERFGERVARLPRREREALDDSGIAGTVVRHSFTYAAARWLAGRFPDDVEIDWRAYAAPDRLDPLLMPLLARVEEDTFEDTRAGIMSWIARAKGAFPHSDLAWLVRQERGAALSPAQWSLAYECAEVPLVWRLGDGRGAITHNALRGIRVAHRTGMRRPAADSKAEIARPLERMELLAPRDAKRVLDVWRAALFARTRGVYPVEQANERECYLADLGEGVQIAVVGVRPPARAVLEVNYGFLLLANGRPMGYGGFTPLFRQANTGVNIFPDFRGSEAAFVFEQYLRMIHTIADCTRFIINPYQLGDGNDEALASGAYWFYYRLGFRSAGAAGRRLADREFARLRANRGYRVPIAALRKLGSEDVHLALAGESADGLFEERWLEDLAAGATALIAREGVVERRTALHRIAGRVAASLGVAAERWPAADRRSLAAFAPIVGQIEGLAVWPAADKETLVELIRLRCAPLEREFARHARDHVALRLALAEVARRRHGEAAQHRRKK
ncbi:MAG TPA: hypothetical protein VLC47_03060 [Burkholderiales bacterium]|nr:hypothetical protein [Burkholderiales bacterium]